MPMLTKNQPIILCLHRTNFYPTTYYFQYYCEGAASGSAVVSDVVVNNKTDGKWFVVDVKCLIVKE